MPTRTSTAVWKGNLKEGTGRVTVDESFDGPYSFASRFEEGNGTNPEELLAGAHAACFSMALSHALAEAGYWPKQVQTEASAQLDKVDDGFAITRIKLETVAVVPDIGAAEFQQHAARAKTDCPVSKALAGVEIELDAALDRDRHAGNARV